MMSQHLTPSTWVPSSASWWSQVSGVTASRAHCWMWPVTACASRASHRKEPQSRHFASAENHFGPLGLYLSAGFTVHREDEDGSVFVRRHL